MYTEKFTSGKPKSGRFLLSFLLIVAMVMAMVIPQAEQTASYATTREINTGLGWTPDVVQGDSVNGYTNAQTNPTVTSPHPAGPTLAQSTKVGYAGHEWVIIGYNGNGVYSSAKQATLLLANADSYAATSRFHSTTSGNANEYNPSVLKTTYNALIGSGSGFINTSDATNGAVLTKETSSAYIVPRTLEGGSGLLTGRSLNTYVSQADTLATVANSGTGINNTSQYADTKYYVNTDNAFDWYAYDKYRKTGYSPAYTGTYDPDKVAGIAVNSQLLWPLSFAEASLLDNSIRTYKSAWWLRSPGNGNIAATYVDLTGSVYGNLIVSIPYGVRPALNLNLQSAIFTSAASSASGKSAATAGSGFASATAAANSKIKFTMEDSAQTLSTISLDSPVSPQATRKIAFSYTGATTGTDQYVSAVLKDSNGKVVYYAKLADALSASAGTVDQVLTGVADGSYTLQIFSEQTNGENYTDFCSVPQTFNIIVDNTLGDKTALIAFTGKVLAADLHEENFTATAWSKLQTALSSANVVIGDSAATQPQVDSALTALQGAYDALTHDHPLLKHSHDQAYGGVNHLTEFGRSVTIEIKGDIRDVVGFKLNGTDYPLTSEGGDVYSILEGDKTIGTIAKGSAIVTLPSAFSDRLANGTHKVEVVFTDAVGTASSIADLVVNRSDDGKGNADGSDPSKGSAILPKTGDDIPLALIIAGGVLSLCGLLFFLFALRRRRREAKA